MLLGVSALLIGLWAGLLRIGWDIPPVSPTILLGHGAFMVTGFLGALISLEKAIGLALYHPRRRIFYIFPLFAAVGTILLVFPVPDFLPRLLNLISALGYVAMFVMIMRLQPNSHHAVMGIAAVAWAGGNLLWLLGREINALVPWWAAFLVLTIAGERLEMARLLKLTNVSRALYLFSAGLVVEGLILSLLNMDIGARVIGAGWLALGAWMLRYDVALRTIRGKGLARFIAYCLLPGYVWMVFAGILWLVLGWNIPSGPLYDAQLHTVFIGFVMSMIFGHAPVIIPAVLGILIKYHPYHYGYLALLHVSLIIRIIGDLFFLPEVRSWGGLLNEVAILLFLGAMVASRTKPMKIR